MKSFGADSESLRANKLTLVERLADDLAHEIKNPLHSMVINLEVLKRRVARSGAPGSDEHLRYVGILATELERVSRRVDLMLRMVRPERGGTPLTLPEALEELLELVELERERYGVEIVVQTAPAPARTRIPPETARQLLLNLLLLAIDAAGRGGSLEISTPGDAREESLRLMARRHPERSAEDGDGGLEQGMMHSSARALLESLDGRLIITPAANGGRGATEIVAHIPRSTP